MFLPHCAVWLSIDFVVAGVAVAHPIISTRASGAQLLCLLLPQLLVLQFLLLPRQCQMRQLAKIFYGKVEQSMKHYKGSLHKKSPGKSHDISAALGCVCVCVSFYVFTATQAAQATLQHPVATHLGRRSVWQSKGAHTRIFPLLGLIAYHNWSMGSGQ